MTKGGPTTMVDYRKPGVFDEPEQKPNERARNAAKRRGADNYGDGEQKPNKSLARMRAKYTQVSEGGKTIIYHTGFDPETRRKLWFREPIQTFKDRYRTALIQKEGGQTITMAEALLNHPHLKIAKGTCIDPEDKPGALVYPDSEGQGFLNLWSGWGVEPKPGETTVLKEMIRDSLCGGHQNQFEFLMKALAWKIQHPSEILDVALVFTGGKGIGKTTFGERVMGRIFGNHFFKAVMVDQVTGRFRGHLRETMFLFADEAFRSVTRENVGALNALITDKEIPIEAKGKDIIRAKNRVALMVGANDWTVPLTTDDRRYFIADVSTHLAVPQDLTEAEKEKHPNAAYWRKFDVPLSTGELQGAFLHELMHMPISDGWHPRYNIPLTRAAAEAKNQSLRGFDKYWRMCLNRGELPVFDMRDDVGGPKEIDFDDETEAKSRSGYRVWSEGEMRIKPTALVAEYESWLQKHNSERDRRCTIDYVLERLEYFHGLIRARSKQMRYWRIPKLNIAQEQFAAKLGSPDMFSQPTEGGHPRSTNRG